MNAVLNRKKPHLWWSEPWTVVEGCTPCSAGCAECWSAAIYHRWRRQQDIAADREPLTDAEGRWTGELRLRWDRLDDPLRWRTPCVAAVWNDLFHADVGDEFTAAAFDAMLEAEKHAFLVLTKRPATLRGYLEDWDKGAHRGVLKPRPNVDNIILGVTCESNEYLSRVEQLVKVPAATRWVNAHLLGPLDELHHDLSGIDWLTIECNRPFHGDPAEWWSWCRNLIDQCEAFAALVWVKQGPAPTGRVTHDLAEFPSWARRREVPPALEPFAEEAEDG